MSSSSSVELGYRYDIPISTLPLPLSYTVNPVGAPITKIGKSVFDRSNRFGVKIGLPSLA